VLHPSGCYNPIAPVRVTAVLGVGEVAAQVGTAAPLRRAAGDGDVVNLWAGQTHTLAGELAAAEVVRTLTDDAHVAVAGIARRLGV